MSDVNVKISDRSLYVTLLTPLRNRMVRKLKRSFLLTGVGKAVEVHVASADARTSNINLWMGRQYVCEVCSPLDVALAALNRQVRTRPSS